MFTENMDHIIGRAETDFGQQKKSSGLANGMNKESFLKLLVTQLEHQDPLEPKADTEFVAQLAQFSSLEQLTNINDGINKFDEVFGRQDLVSSVSFIGKQVLANGHSLSKEGNQVSMLKYSIEDTASNVLANIFDGNGNLVRTVHFGARQPGGHEFQWDGKDYTGKTVGDGVYTVALAAEGVHGEPVMVETSVSGIVSGINTQGEQTMLRLKDGREVFLPDILEVVAPEHTAEAEEA